MPNPNPTESVQTDTWNTSQPKADATNLSSLPKDVSDELDGKDHSDDAVRPDEGGRVFDENVAAVNRG